MKNVHAYTSREFSILAPPTFLLTLEITAEVPDPPRDIEVDHTRPVPIADLSDSFADPEPKANICRQASSPKLLMHAPEGLDFTNDNIDFVSIDVDDSKAPKGTSCPE